MAAMNRFRVAARNLKLLEEELKKTERPDFKLRRDIKNAKEFFEEIKAQRKAKRRAKKPPDTIRAQLVIAEEQAAQALGVETTARKALKIAEDAVKASIEELVSLRERNASKPLLEASMSERDKARLEFRNQEDAHVTAEDHLYDANSIVFSLRRRLRQHTQVPRPEEPTEIADKHASFNGNDDPSQGVKSH